MGILGSFTRARVNVDHPDAFAICDICGFARNHSDLRKEMEYRGNALTWTGFLVCYDTCLDKPYEFDRPIALPPDPVPVQNARPPAWAQQEAAPNSDDQQPIDDAFIWDSGQYWDADWSWDA